MDALTGLLTNKRAQPGKLERQFGTGERRIQGQGEPSSETVYSTDRELRLFSTLRSYKHEAPCRVADVATPGTANDTIGYARTSGGSLCQIPRANLLEGATSGGIRNVTPAGAVVRDVWLGFERLAKDTLREWRTDRSLSQLRYELTSLDADHRILRWMESPLPPCLALLPLRNPGNGLAEQVVGPDRSAVLACGAPLAVD